MTAKKTELPFIAEVWGTLSSINCNEQTHEKNGLTYLSWAWAWGILMEYYPESEYEFSKPKYLPNGTVEVWVTITIKQGLNSAKRRMWLAVMNYKNQAVVDPDSTAISNTRMRCLTKCLAMFGLGHYIYAGEDIPRAEAKEVKKEAVVPIPKKIEACTNINQLVALWGSLTNDQQEQNRELFHEIKTRFQEALK